MTRRITALLFACLVLAGLIAGCGGGSDSTSSSSSAETGSSASSGKPEVTTKTIGVLDQAAASSANQIMEQVVNELADSLGWEVKSIDAQGSPEKITRGATTLQNEGVDALVAISIEPSLIRSSLEAFQGDDVPTCQIGGGQPASDLYTMQFGEDEFKLGEELGEYIAQVEPDAKVLALTNTSIYAGKERYAGFQKGLETAPGAEVVAESEINLEDPIGSTTKATENGLAAHPEATAVYSIFDLFNPPATAAVKRIGSDAKVYGHFTSEVATKELRDPSNPLAALGDSSLSKSSGLCMEQFLSQLIDEVPANPDAIKTNPLTYEVIGKDDVDKFVEPGSYFAFPPEVASEEFLKQFESKYTLPTS